MAFEPTLKDTFNSFASYGGKGEAREMDYNAWMKCCRDCKIISKNVPETDAHIVYNKIKPKADRRIGYDQFEDCIQHLASKAGEDQNEFIAKFVESTPGVKTHRKRLKNREISDSVELRLEKTLTGSRLVDTSKYTGSTERFDESGEGKGLEGRADYDAKANDGYVGAYPRQ